MSSPSEKERLILQVNNEKLRAIAEIEDLIQRVNQVNVDSLKTNFESFESKKSIILEIEPNIKLSQKNFYHLSMTNNDINKIDSDNINQVQVVLKSSGNNLYGQAIVSYGNYVYSIGGSHLSGEASKLISVYDLDGELKQSGELLIKKRKFSACIEVNKKLFVIGGQNSLGKGIISIEVIDLDLFTNVKQINMNIDREFPSVCSFNDFVYIASSKNSIIEKIDPENLNVPKKIPIDKALKVYFIAQVEKYLVAFSEKNYTFLDVNDRVVKVVENKIKNIQWSQSECGVNNNVVFFKDYFTGKFTKIKLDLP